jgi:hypothetical protein
MKRDLSTHEWQVALVQVLERLQGFERQGNANRLANLPTE